MKKTFLLITLLLFTWHSTLTAQTYEQHKVQLQFFNHYGSVNKKGGSNSGMLGSEFFNEEWAAMDIKLKEQDTLLHFDAVKMNLVNSNLEVFFQGQEKVIAQQHFEYVRPEAEKKNIFVPANIFHYEGKPLTGFMEVLGGDKIKVLVQHYTYIREPNAQAHIVGGYTVNRLLKASTIFLYDGDKLMPIRRKKDLQEFFSRKSNTLRKYLKENNPNLKDPYELLELVEKFSVK